MSQLLHRAARRCFFALFLIQSAGVHVAGFSVFESEGTKVHADSYKTCTKVLIYCLMNLFAYFISTKLPQ